MDTFDVVYTVVIFSGGLVLGLFLGWIWRSKQLLHTFITEPNEGQSSSMTEDDDDQDGQSRFLRQPASSGSPDFHTSRYGGMNNLN